MCLTHPKQHSSLGSYCRYTTGGGYDESNTLWRTDGLKEVEELSTTEDPPLPTPPTRVIAGWSFMFATSTCEHCFELTCAVKTLYTCQGTHRFRDRMWAAFSHWAVVRFQSNYIILVRFEGLFVVLVSLFVIRALISHLLTSPITSSTREGGASKPCPGHSVFSTKRLA